MKVVKKPRGKPVQFYLQIDIIDKLKKFSFKNNVSSSQVISQLIDKYLREENHGNKNKTNR